jgi:uncharacterized protein (DUF433 family)
VEYGRIDGRRLRCGIGYPAPETSTIDAMDYDRITAAPDMLEGKPCIRRLRISVETVVRLVAASWSFDEILAEYPDLEREDIIQALQYAAAATSVHHYQLRQPA